MQRRHRFPSRAGLGAFLLAACLCRWSDAAAFSSLHQTGRLEQAIALADQGKLEESLSILRELQSAGPQDPEVLARLGEVLFKKGEYFDALQPLQRALAAQAGHKRATQYLGSSLYFLGRMEDAIPHLEQSLGWFPHNVNFQNILSLCYIQTKRPDEARRLMARIFAIEESTPQAHLIAGRLYRESRIFDVAESLLRTALQLDSQLPMAHLYLGETLFEQRRTEEALLAFRREIELNPAMWMGHYRTGETLFELNRLDEAVPHLQRATWLNKYFAGPYFVLGQILLRKDRVAEAIANLEIAVRYDYTNSKTHYVLGRALLKAGRREEAKREFDLAAEMGNEKP